MLVLIVGLVVFLGVHSVRIVAEDWRTARIARLGENGWKGIYSLTSGVGLALIVWGYSLARAEPVVLWNAPVWSRHLASLLVLLAFILFAATYAPRNHLKAAIGHPMFAAVKVWAFAHLLSNGTLADLLLFGSFMIWAALGFRSARGRDRRNHVSYPAGTARGTLIAVAAGTVAWAAFAFYLHGLLFGVRPMG